MRRTGLLVATMLAALLVLSGVALAKDIIGTPKSEKISGTERRDVIDALGGALPSHLVVLAHKGRQFERIQMVAEQDLRRRAHAARPASRLR